MTVSWTPVDGAAGYLLHVRDGADDRWTILDHGGGDLLPLVSPPHADTTAPPPPAPPRRYAVESLAVPDVTAGEHALLSPPAVAAPRPPATSPAVVVEVDAAAAGIPTPRPWRPMIGAEHLSQLFDRAPAHPGAASTIGEEFRDALRMAHDDLGVEAVRAHAIFHDELGLVPADAAVANGRDGNGRTPRLRLEVHAVDRVLDAVRSIGLRPIVELSFMPAALAIDPSATVFTYRAIVSPPRSLDAWGRLVSGFVGHLRDRYGSDEVVRWAFEVWNEPNLAVFWTGDMADYFALYDVSAAAVRGVDARFRVGGPATAAGGWLGAFLEHVERSGSPLDFLSTHMYGNEPPDLRPLLAAHGREHLPVWWTEWGVTPTHFASVNDGVFGAAFLLRGMRRAAANEVDALSYWVVSDHFEELGRPPRLFHGGFGLLTVGNLRKPRWWALQLLERLGEVTLPIEARGDGAEALVQAWATRTSSGALRILAWNGTLDQSKRDGDEALGRSVRLRLRGLDDGRWRLRHDRLDASHSNLAVAWEGLGSPDWPDAAGWRTLRDADRLEELEPSREIEVAGGTIELTLDLPMPSISFLELERLPG